MNILKSRIFILLMAGLVAFVAKFFIPTFPLDAQGLASIFLFLLGLLGVYPTLRFGGITGATIGDLLHSLPFLEMLSGAVWFVIHFYAPTFPFAQDAVLMFFLFILAYFQIYPELQARGVLHQEDAALLTSFQWKPGMYRVRSSRLNVRGTPDIGSLNNITGIQLTNGKLFPVYKIAYDTKNRPFGQITADDVIQANYVCLYDFNQLYAEFVQPFPDQSTGAPGTIDGSLKALYLWAKSIGYPGPFPF